MKSFSNVVLKRNIIYETWKDSPTLVHLRWMSNTVHELFYLVQGKSMLKKKVIELNQEMLSIGVEIDGH